MADVVWVAEAPTTGHPLHGQNRTDRWLAWRLHPRLFEASGASSVVEAQQLDGTTWTLHLADRRWSDRTPLSGADVCATVARLSDEAHPTRFTGLVRAAVADCAPSGVDPRAVTLTLRRPMADPGPWLSVPVLPAHRPDWVAWVPGPGPEPPFVALGAETRRHDRKGWSVEGPRPARIGVSDDPLRELGRAGLAALVDAPDLEEARRTPGVSVERWGPVEVWALVLDTTRPPFDDPALRARFDAAIDREAFAAAWFGRDPGLDRQPWTLVSGPWPPGHPSAARGILPPLLTVDDAPGVEGTVVTPLPLPAGAERALLGLAPHPVDARTWAWSVLAGGQAGTAVAALAPLEGPPCAWFATRAGAEGPRNVFAFSDAEVDAACRALDAGDPEAGRTLHGLLADRRPAVFLFARQERIAVRAP